MNYVPYQTFLNVFVKPGFANVPLMVIECDPVYASLNLLPLPRLGEIMF